VTKNGGKDRQFMQLKFECNQGEEERENEFLWKKMEGGIDNSCNLGLHTIIQFITIDR